MGKALKKGDRVISNAGTLGYVLRVYRHGDTNMWFAEWKSMSGTVYNNSWTSLTRDNKDYSKVIVDMINGAEYYNADVGITYRMNKGILEASTSTQSWQPSSTKLNEVIHKLVKVNHDVKSGEYILVTRTTFGSKSTFVLRALTINGDVVCGYREYSNELSNVDLSDDNVSYEKMDEEEIKVFKYKKTFINKGRQPYEYRVGDVISHYKYGTGEVVETTDDGFVKLTGYDGTDKLVLGKNCIIKFWSEDKVKID